MDNLDFNFFCRDCRQTEEYRRENCFTRFRTRHFEKGEYIAFKGGRVRELAVLVKGAINVSFVLNSGLVIRSINHNPPSPIGAIAILSKDDRYLADIKAIESSTIIAITKEDLIVQMGKCQEFMMSFIDFSASRVGALSEHLALLSQRSIAAKLAYYIFICSEDGKHYKFTKSIRGVAEYLCVERPSLSRVIAKFVGDGVISYNNGEGTITNVKELKNFVE